MSEAEKNRPHARGWVLGTQTDPPIGKDLARDQGLPTPPSEGEP